jgi:hypothetical protein
MTQDETKVINRIQEAIQGPQKVPASEVKNWLRHPSLDVLSVATGLILEHSRQIEPPLTMQEICNSVSDYYRRCLQEGHESEYVPSFHEAGYELARWFRSLWDDPEVPREYLADLKTMLAELYKSADQAKADRLVNAVIEHLFETPGVPDFFADWKSDAALARGFARAMEWVNGGGTSPLTKGIQR